MATPGYCAHPRPHVINILLDVYHILRPVNVRLRPPFAPAYSQLRIPSEVQLVCVSSRRVGIVVSNRTRSIQFRRRCPLDFRAREWRGNVTDATRPCQTMLSPRPSPSWSMTTW